MDQLSLNYIFRFEGLLLLLFFSIFIYYVFELSHKNKKEITDDKLEIKNLSSIKIFLYILGGITALYFGGKWTVDGAIALAKFLGMSEYFISLTIISIGTSLPELITSIIAALKKDPDMAVGNVIGSNIFNIFWILGISSIITPIAIPSFAIVDLLILLMVTFLLFLFMFIGKKHELERHQGLFFVCAYILYLFYLIKRG